MEAREAITQYFAAHLVDKTETGQLSPADKFLAWLWNEGFKIVPVGGEDVAHDRHESPAEPRTTNANSTSGGEPLQAMPGAEQGQ
jgi:hypothetical protein